jgi:periplasmic protein TonB
MGAFLSSKKMLLGLVVMLLFTSCERKVVPSVQPTTYEEMVCLDVAEPVFPGGSKALATYLTDHIRYPKEAQKAKVEGKVFVTFVINRQGTIKDVKVLKGLGYGTDAEALRLVAKMPRWEPGKHNGKAVSVKYNLPISFELNDNTKNHKGLDGKGAKN